MLALLVVFRSYGMQGLVGEAAVPAGSGASEKPLLKPGFPRLQALALAAAVEGAHENARKKNMVYIAIAGCIGL